jgi:hypothetical protein
VRDDACIQGAIIFGRRIEIAQVVEDTAAGAKVGEERAGAADSIVPAADGSIVIQPATSNIGHTAGVVGDSSAAADANEAGDARAAGIVVAAKGVVMREGTVGDRERGLAQFAAAVSRNDRPAKRFADENHGAAAGIAVAADSLIVIERAAVDRGKLPSAFQRRTAMPAHHLARKKAGR